MLRNARAVNDPMSFVESFSQPDTTDDLYCDDDDDNEADDDESDDDELDGDRGGSKKESVALTPVPVEQRRRPSLVIAGDAQSLETVQTVHSPKSQRLISVSPRLSLASDASLSPHSVRSASPKPSSPPSVPSPIKPSPSAVVDTASSARGWQSVWAAKLSGTSNRLDLLASIGLLVYSYRGCLVEHDECHEECLADPDTTSRRLPFSMASAAIAMLAVYGRSRPAALLECAQTTIAVSWTQRMALLSSVALATSHGHHRTLVSDGTTVALVGFLVCRHRHRFYRDGSAWWTLSFLAAALCASTIDMLSAGDEAVAEPVSVLVGIFVVVATHLMVSTLRSLLNLDDAVGSESEKTADLVEKKTQ